MVALKSELIQRNREGRSPVSLIISSKSGAHEQRPSTTPFLV
jgi:hypothetical protein